MLAHVELVRLVKSRKIKAVFFDGLNFLKGHELVFYFAHLLRERPHL